MSGESIKIAVKSLYVNRFVDDTLCAVEEHRHAVPMGGRHDLLNGIDDAQHIGNMGDGHQFDPALCGGQTRLQCSD